MNKLFTQRRSFIQQQLLQANRFLRAPQNKQRVSSIDGVLVQSSALPNLALCSHRQVISQLHAV